MSAVTDCYGEFIGHALREAKRVAIQETATELAEEIRWHMRTLETTKGVRPAMVRAAALMCGARRGVGEDELIRRAAAVELLHRASLAVDDVIDQTPMRSGQLALHVRFTSLRACAAAAELNLAAWRLVDEDVDARRLMRSVASAIAVAEAIQQRDSDPHGGCYPIAAWKRIALGDTGAMFRLAIGFGGMEPEAPMIDALSYLRHGLDDVEDLIGAEPDLADVKDGVPTLLACFVDTRSESALRAAVEPALEWLRGEPLREWKPSEFEPFFADFEAKWQELELRAKEGK